MGAGQSVPKKNVSRPKKQKTTRQNNKYKVVNSNNNALNNNALNNNAWNDNRWNNAWDGDDNNFFESISEEISCTLNRDTGKMNCVRKKSSRKA
jgi:hypothetical protein